MRSFRDVELPDGGRALAITETERDDYSTWVKKTDHIQIDFDADGQPTGMHLVSVRSQSSFRASSRLGPMRHRPAGNPTVLIDVHCAL